ncbi:MAG: lasso peptide biosynthesis B2 protein [Acidobacteriota bacterium]
MAGLLKSLCGAPARWRRRTRAERVLLVEACVLLGLARLALLVLPFRRLSVWLGVQMNDPESQIDAYDLLRAREVGDAVRSAANNMPWVGACLPQAVAAQWMLKRRRITGTLCLGVAKDGTNPEMLTAHAWLRCGDDILTGAAGHEQFAVVAEFFGRGAVRRPDL